MSFGLDFEMKEVFGGRGVGVHTSSGLVDIHQLEHYFISSFLVIGHMSINSEIVGFHIIEEIDEWLIIPNILILCVSTIEKPSQLDFAKVFIEVIILHVQVFSHYSSIDQHPTFFPLVINMSIKRSHYLIHDLACG